MRMTVFQQHATFSERADAAYVYLREGEVARTQSLDDYRNLDIDTNGNVLGVEFLGVSAGVSLDGIADAATVRRLLHDCDLRVPA